MVMMKKRLCPAQRRNVKTMQSRQTLSISTREKKVFIKVGVLTSSEEEK